MTTAAPTARSNDVDLLGPPRACRRLPAALWSTWLVLLLLAAAVATILEALA